MLKNKKLLLLTSAVLLLPLLAGLVLWQKLPERMPVHWNAAGEIDGYGSRAMVVFGLFGFLFIMHWFCIGASALDPKNKDQSSKAAAVVLWVMPALSLLMGVIVYGTALGLSISVNIILPVFMGWLFVFVGSRLPECRRNYTIGIKIPWALDDEENWNATHRFAGKVWMVGGVLFMASALVHDALLLILPPLLALMLVLPTLYSYLYYKKRSR